MQSLNNKIPSPPTLSQAPQGFLARIRNIMKGAVDHIQTATEAMASLIENGRLAVATLVEASPSQLRRVVFAGSTLALPLFNAGCPPDDKHGPTNSSGETDSSTETQPTTSIGHTTEAQCSNEPGSSFPCTQMTTSGHPSQTDTGQFTTGGASDSTGMDTDPSPTTTDTGATCDQRGFECFGDCQQGECICDDPCYEGGTSNCYDKCAKGCFDQANNPAKPDCVPDPRIPGPLGFDPNTPDGQPNGFVVGGDVSTPNSTDSVFYTNDCDNPVLSKPCSNYVAKSDVWTCEIAPVDMQNMVSRKCKITVTPFAVGFVEGVSNSHVFKVTQ